MRTFAISAAVAAILGASTPSLAQETIKIGVLNDMSSIFSDASGMGSVAAAKLAIEDFAKENPNPGFKVEVVFADHQNKPDVGSAVARKWYEAEKVDLIIDIPNSGVALAVSELARQFDKVVIISGAGATNLTGDKCNANTVHWTWDTYATAQGSVKASAGPGADKWFLLTANYAFGLNLEENAMAALRASGNTVAGSVRHPFNSSDFSSFLLQAQESKANVIGFANAGGDFSAAAKQAVEFGFPKRGIRLAALWGGIMELRSLGLDSGQGLQYVLPFYWDANAKTRALNDRYKAVNSGKSLSEEQAGVYSGVLGFLRGAAATKSRSGKEIVAEIKKLKFDDIMGQGYVRVDGRKMHDMHLYQAKAPTESKSDWDVFKFVKTIPADQAFAPPAAVCPLVKG